MTKPASATERLQIVSLTVENVKRIKAVHIKPGGALVTISGKNGSGKSSVLDAIWWALQGKKVIQGEPIRRGEKEAMIRIDFGRLVVTRHFWAEEGGEYTTSLVVESKDGETFASPQHMLDQFYSSLSFDPLAFMRRDKKGKVDDLLRLVNVGIDPAAIERQNKTDFDKRTEVNRRVKSLQERVASAAAELKSLGAEDRSDNLDPIATGDLLSQMTDAAEKNSAIERERVRREGARLEAENKRARATRLRDEAEALRQRAAELDKESERMDADAVDALAALDKSPALEPAVDVARLREQVDQANIENERRRKVRDAFTKFDAAKVDLKAAEAEAEAFTTAIDARTKSKDDALAAAKMPIPGLAFGEGEVLYNGLPVEQASQGEQIRVTCAIGMAMNPGLGVILLKDAAFLDEDGVETVRQWAEAEGYQAWMERVDSSGKVGIVMEDGAARVAIA